LKQHHHEKINRMAEKLLFSYDVGVVVVDLENHITFISSCSHTKFCDINMINCNLKITASK